MWGIEYFNKEMTTISFKVYLKCLGISLTKFQSISVWRFQDILVETFAWLLFKVYLFPYKEMEYFIFTLDILRNNTLKFCNIFSSSYNSSKSIWQGAFTPHIRHNDHVDGTTINDKMSLPCLTLRRKIFFEGNFQPFLNIFHCITWKIRFSSK